MAIAQVDEANVLPSCRFYKVFEKRHDGAMMNCETMLGSDRPEVERDAPVEVLGDPCEHGRELLSLGRSVPCNVEHEFDVDPRIDGTFYKGSSVLQEPGRASHGPICFLGKALESDKQCIQRSN
jgi:hypothetical protein